MWTTTAAAATAATAATAAAAAAAAASEDLKLITRDSTEKVIFIIWNFFSLSDPRKALKVPIASRDLLSKK